MRVALEYVVSTHNNAHNKHVLFLIMQYDAYFKQRFEFCYYVMNKTTHVLHVGILVFPIVIYFTAIVIA